MYDFHTHDPAARNALISVRTPEEAAPAADRWFSLELHPWHWHEGDLPEQYAERARLPVFAALGEAGLDRLKGGDFTAQLACFRQLAALSAEIGKPLVIHAVRALPEIMAVLKHHPLRHLIHGFRGGAGQFRLLAERGFLISLHPPALRNEALAELLRREPGLLSTLGLETDDGDVPITEIYMEAAARLRLPADVLATRLAENFRAFVAPR